MRSLGRGGRSLAAPPASLPFPRANPCRSGAPCPPPRGCNCGTAPPEEASPTPHPQPPKHGEARPSRRHFVSSHGAGSWGGHNQRNNPPQKLKKNTKLKNIRGERSLLTVSPCSLLKGCRRFLHKNTPPVNNAAPQPARLPPRTDLVLPTALTRCSPAQTLTVFVQ